MIYHQVEVHLHKWLIEGWSVVKHLPQHFVNLEFAVTRRDHANDRIVFGDPPVELLGIRVQHHWKPVPCTHPFIVEDGCIRSCPLEQAACLRGKFLGIHIVTRVLVALLDIEGNRVGKGIEQDPLLAVESCHGLHELEGIGSHALATCGLVCTQRIHFEIVANEVDDGKSLGLFNGEITQWVFGPQNVNLVLLAKEQNQCGRMGHLGQVIGVDGLVSIHAANVRQGPRLSDGESCDPLRVGRGLD